MPTDPTVIVAVPVAADPVLEGTIAVIVVIPPSTLPIAVARPPESIVATRTSLETHVTWLVKSCVVGESVKLPIAMNCDASPITATGCWPGMTVIDVSSRAGGCPCTFTVTVALPVAPFMVAVMVAVPEPTAVAIPLERTVTTVGALEAHCA